MNCTSRLRDSAEPPPQPAARPPMLLQCPTPHYAQSACAVPVIRWALVASDKLRRLGFVVLFAIGGRRQGSIYDTGASDGFHSYLPIPVLAADSKPGTLDVIVFDGD